MNNQEKQAFEKCMKQIKRLLIEEKQTKEKLERIQKAKLEWVRLLLDGEYYEKTLKDVSEWKKNKI